jgi:short-subunit dehydrogenase
MVDLNIRAVVELCHVFLPAMASKGDCGILNVGSTGSFVPVPWAAVYGATKAFVLSFSEALYYEYRDRGVQVTALCPGNTESNFARVANAAAEKGAKAGDSPEMVADVGLDALLKGACSVIPGASNQQVA